MDASTRSQLCQVLLLARGLSAPITARMEGQFGAQLAANGPVAILASLAIEGPLRPRDLQPGTGLSGAGLSNLLRRLEEGGLIARTSGGHPGDHRAVAVTLTEAGRRAEAGISELITSSLRDTSAEIKGLVAVLEALGAQPPTGSAPVTAADPSRVALALASLGVRLVEALRLPGDMGKTVDPTASVALAALSRTDDCRPSYLGDVLGITSGGVTRLVDRLEAAGLVERSYAPLADDRRSVVVSLTARGHEYLDTVLANVTGYLDTFYAVVLAFPPVLDSPAS